MSGVLNMKKKVLAIIVLFGMVYFAMILYSIIAVRIVLLVILALGLIICIYACLGIFLYRKFINKMIVDPISNIERNYDRLVVGDISATQMSEDRSFRLLVYHSNLVTDIELIKRYHSFVKNGGQINLYICARNRKYFCSKNLDSFSYPLLHKVTLYENQIGKKRYYIGFLKTALLFPLFQLFTTKRDVASFDEMNEQMKELIRFCTERSLTFHIYR